MNKEQLKQIIKEELRKYMNEAEPAPAQTQNQPNAIDFYTKAMQDNSFKSMVQSGMTNAKKEFMSDLVVRSGSNIHDYIADIKPVIDTFGIQPPAPKEHYVELLESSKGQECNLVIYRLIRRSMNLWSYVVEHLNADISTKGEFYEFFMYQFIKQFKNDSDVIEAVKKAKEQMPQKLA